MSRARARATTTVLFEAYASSSTFDLEKLLTNNQNHGRHWRSSLALLYYLIKTYPHPHPRYFYLCNDPHTNTIQLQQYIVSNIRSSNCTFSTTSSFFLLIWRNFWPIIKIITHLCPWLSPSPSSSSWSSLGALLEGGLWNLCLKLTTVEQTIKQLSPDFIILSLASSSLSSLQWHRHPFIVNIMWCQPYTPMIICGTLFSWEAVQPRCLYYYYYYTSNTILIVLVGEDLKRMSFILDYSFISNIKI